MISNYSLNYNIIKQMILDNNKLSIYFELNIRLFNVESSNMFKSLSKKT